MKQYAKITRYKYYLLAIVLAAGAYLVRNVVRCSSEKQEIFAQLQTSSRAGSLQDKTQSAALKRSEVTKEIFCQDEKLHNIEIISQTSELFLHQQHGALDFTEKMLDVTCTLSEAGEPCAHLVADVAYAAQDRIRLLGNLQLDHPLGRIKADVALITRDEGEKSGLDFRWIELKGSIQLLLAEGGVLHCHHLLIDQSKQLCEIEGAAQLVYQDARCQIYADKAKIYYRLQEDHVEATQITLYDNVKLIDMESCGLEKPRYALAERVYYYPKEQHALLEGEQVLFYDPLRNMQMTARSIHAHKDPITQKESVEGRGNVHFLFDPDTFDLPAL